MDRALRRGQGQEREVTLQAAKAIEGDTSFKVCANRANGTRDKVYSRSFGRRFRPRVSRTPATARGSVPFG
jgi:hypothetical protein